jgi:invasion protein IalB
MSVLANPLEAARRIALTAAMAAIAAAGANGPASAQGQVKAVHGDWEIRCDTPAGARDEQCALTQYVLAADQENIGLNVILLKTADQKARLLRVIAPLGVILPRGLTLQIDDERIGVAEFIRCLPEGCMAEVLLEDALLDQMRKGTTATFIVYQSVEDGIGIPISLTGFSAGYDALP